MVLYFSREILDEINKAVTSINSDPHIIQNEATLDYLVESVQYKYEKYSENEKLFLKAAYMLDLLANKGHIFTEGNKRTALVATNFFLFINGYTLEVTGQKELVTYVLSVAAGKESISSIARWLKQYGKKLAKA